MEAFILLFVFFYILFTAILALVPSGFVFLVWKGLGGTPKFLPLWGAATIALLVASFYL